MRARVRSTLLTAGLVLFAIAGWIYFAPSQIGGSTTYVVTSGISMEPRFHSGDLALVRPVSQYRVGEIVAYHSSLLHVTVLHRIIAIDGGRYVFKGDNNSFIDPIRVSRADLVGALWLRIAHGGVFLRFVHTPIVAALLIGAVCVLLLIGGQETRRRRRRRTRGPGLQSTPARRLPELTGPVDVRPWLLGAGIAAAAFLALGVLALAMPTERKVSHKVAYTQRMRFGYTAAVAPGPVYPDGRLHTGDPIFLHLVHRIELTSDYRLDTDAARQVSGTEQLVLALSSPTGWTRRFPIGHPMRFEGVGLRTATRLDVGTVQSLLERIQLLTGVAGDSGASIELIADVHIHGKLAGEPLGTSFEPSLSLELQPLQLEPGNVPSAPGAPSNAGGFDQAQAGSVSVPGTAPNQLAFLGASLAISELRPLAIGGALASIAVLLVLGVLARLRAPFEERVRIQARFGHLIVPIVATPEMLDRIPFDVTSIEALVRLAESGERLILHHRDPIADTYLVNDDTGLYRYQVGPTRVVWGEWQPPRPPDGPEPSVAAAVPVAPPPAFLTLSETEPEPLPQSGGVPLSAYTRVPPRSGATSLSGVAGRVARELVRGARRRRRRPGRPPAFSDSGD